jgi:hypothetical protein
MLRRFVKKIDKKAISKQDGETKPEGTGSVEVENPIDF